MPAEPMTDESKLLALPEAVFNRLSQLAGFFEAVASACTADDYRPIVTADEMREWADTLYSTAAQVKALAHRPEAASLEADARDAARWRAVRDPCRIAGGIAVQPAAWVEGPGNKHVDSEWLTGEAADRAADELIDAALATENDDG